ncbi:MAG: hypothetical protein KDC87_00305, partial [Planctomycetes bacterium]|nr:hypothetical protein [Planctomycetota bacterium]
MARPADDPGYTDAQLEDWVFTCLESEDPEATARELAKDDAALRRELESMLAELRSEDALAIDSTGLDSAAAALPEKIGPYRPLECVGEGGMGIVYR